MDCKLLLLTLGCILLAYDAAAEFGEEDYNLLQANDINLQRLILGKSKKSKSSDDPVEATRKPTPTLGPNPRPKPVPQFKLKDKKVITIEEYVEVKDIKVSNDN